MLGLKVLTVKMILCTTLSQVKNPPAKFPVIPYCWKFLPPLNAIWKTKTPHPVYAIWKKAHVTKADKKTEQQTLLKSLKFFI